MQSVKQARTSAFLVSTGKMIMIVFRWSPCHHQRRTRACAPAASQQQQITSTTDGWVAEHLILCGSSWLCCFTRHTHKTLSGQRTGTRCTSQKCAFLIWSLGLLWLKSRLADRTVGFVQTLNDMNDNTFVTGSGWWHSAHSCALLTRVGAVPLCTQVL